MAIKVLERGGLPFPRSLPEFQHLFPDQAACASYLERARWGISFVFPHCRTAGKPYRCANRLDVLCCRKCRRGDLAHSWHRYGAHALAAFCLILGGVFDQQPDAVYVCRAVSAATWTFALRDGLSDTSQASRRHGARIRIGSAGRSESRLRLMKPG